MTTYKKITAKKLEKAIKNEYIKNGKELSRFYKIEDGEVVYSEGKNTGGKYSVNWTKITKKIFVEIGKEFGYELISESNKERKNMIAKQQNISNKFKIWQSSNPKEFMSIDQVWFGEDERPIVGIESENTAKFEEIKDDEFQKLLNFSSDFKILIWYQIIDKKYEDNINELQNLINKHKKIDDETFIIISGEAEYYKKTLNTWWKINILRKNRERNRKRRFKAKLDNRI